ncbi:hypothetical protein C8J56DRAFT_892426 [Mycena floridula]|nr:hypothetical protein C8J56DRAFT_892426 [Mycena floridula]
MNPSSEAASKNTITIPCHLENLPVERRFEGSGRFRRVVASDKGLRKVFNDILDEKVRCAVDWSSVWIFVEFPCETSLFLDSTTLFSLTFEEIIWKSEVEVVFFMPVFIIDTESKEIYEVDWDAKSIKEFYGSINQGSI